MSDTSKIAANMRVFREAIDLHDRLNPTHTTWGIGLAHFDMERLGFDEGEEIFPGIIMTTINCTTGNFRILCDGEHDEGRAGAAREAKPVDAVSTRTVPDREPVAA